LFISQNLSVKNRAKFHAGISSTSTLPIALMLPLLDFRALECVAPTGRVGHPKRIRSSPSISSHPAHNESLRHARSQPGLGHIPEPHCHLLIPHRCRHDRYDERFDVGEVRDEKIHFVLTPCKSSDVDTGLRGCIRIWDEALEAWRNPLLEQPSTWDGWFELVTQVWVVSCLESKGVKVREMHAGIGQLAPRKDGIGT
jgi:hypothetical protein